MKIYLIALLSVVCIVSGCQKTEPKKVELPASRIYLVSYRYYLSEATGRVEFNCIWFSEVGKDFSARFVARKKNTYKEVSFSVSDTLKSMLTSVVNNYTVENSFARDLESDCSLYCGPSLMLLIQHDDGSIVNQCGDLHTYPSDICDIVDSLYNEDLRNRASLSEVKLDSVITNPSGFGRYILPQLAPPPPPIKPTIIFVPPVVRDIPDCE